MADAKIKKIIGNDTKIKNIFCKIVNVLAIYQFLVIYTFVVK